MASYAADISVNTNQDVSSAMHCSLRDAIESINQQSLQGGCLVSQGGLADVTSQIFFDLPNLSVISLEAGQLLISRNMHLIGPQNSDISIVAAKESLERVVEISNATLSVVNLTLANGSAVNNDDITSPYLGGVIFANNGRLRLVNSTVHGGSADIGGGIGAQGESTVSLTNSSVYDNLANAGGGIAIIDGASLEADQSNIRDNTARAAGAGLALNNSAKAMITDSEINFNQSLANAQDYLGMGLVFPEETEGGGILVSDNSQLELRSSLVSGNRAIQGAGIKVTSQSSAMIYESRLSKNAGYGVNSVNEEVVTYTNGFGGGISVDAQSFLTMEDTAISSNTSETAAGISMRSTSDATIKKSTISNNIADLWAGGIEILGGATAQIENSTVSNNSTTGVGSQAGGFFILEAGSAEIINSTIAFNRSQIRGGGLVMSDSSVTLISNLITGNQSTSAMDLFDFDGSLEVPGSSNNLFGDSAKIFSESIEFPNFQLFPTANDIIATNTQRDGSKNPNSRDAADIILELAGNGGRTMTHRLSPNSLAIDAGAAQECENFGINEDQRSVPRNDDHCDIGAYELDMGETCYPVKASNSNVFMFCL